jgi:hypothetical protein
VALYENRLVTAVKKGENAGESLVNDRVVRYWSGPISMTNGTATFDRPSHLLDKTVAQKQLATPHISDRRNWGIAAFVQTRTGKILQAISCEL